MRHEASPVDFERIFKVIIKQCPILTDDRKKNRDCTITTIITLEFSDRVKFVTFLTFKIEKIETLNA